MTADPGTEQEGTLEELWDFTEEEVRGGRTGPDKDARRLKVGRPKLRELEEAIRKDSVKKVLRGDPAENLLFAVLCTVYEGITRRQDLYEHLDSMFSSRLGRMTLSPVDVDEALQHGLVEGLVRLDGDDYSVTKKGKKVLRSGRLGLLHEGYWMKRFLKERNVVIISGLFLIFLVIIKLLVGSSVGSQAMLTDGLENLTDLVVVGIIALSLRYDRDRAGAIAIMLFMLFSGTLLGYTALIDIANQEPVETSYWAYIVAGVSAAMNWMLIWLKTLVGRMSGNLSLVSDAKEDGTHLKIAGGVIVGLAFAEFGFYFVDSIVAVLISIVVIWEGIEALRELLFSEEELSVDTIHLSASEQYEDLITYWILGQLVRGPKSADVLNKSFLEGVSLGYRYFDVHAVLGFKDLHEKGIWKHIRVAKKSGLMQERDGRLMITSNGLSLYYKQRVDEMKKVSKRYAKQYSLGQALMIFITAMTAFVLFMMYGESAYFWLVNLLHNILGF